MLIPSVVSSSFSTRCTVASLSLRILQVGLLEWKLPCPSSRGSSQPKDPAQVSCLLHWQETKRAPPRKSKRNGRLVVSVLRDFARHGR